MRSVRVLVVSLLLLALLASTAQSFRLLRAVSNAVDNEIYDSDSGEVAADWKSASITVGEYEAVTIFIAEPNEEDDDFNAGPIAVEEGSDILAPAMEGEPTDGLWDDEDEAILSEVYVKYYCKKEGTATLNMTFSWSTEDEGEKKNSISIRWKKTCKTGRRPGINIGLYDLSDEVVRDGEVQSDFKVKSDNPYVISPAHHFTNFFIWMEEGRGVETLQQPTIEVSSNVLKVLSRGEASVDDTIVMEDASKELTLFYEPSGPGSVIVTVTVNLPPWDPISFSFRKSCGGGHRSGLRIETAEGVEVVSEGVVSPSWSANAKDEDRWVSAKDQYKTTFYIAMENGDEQDWDHASLAATPQRLMSPYLSYDGQFDVAGGVITVTPRALSIFYNCQRAGAGKMHFTIKLPMYDAIDIYWAKKCVKLEPEVDRSVWTANQALLALVLGVALAGGVGYYYYNSQRRSGAPRT